MKKKYSLARMAKQDRIYDYIYRKFENGEKLPGLKGIQDDLGIPFSTVRECLLELAKRRKLIYRRGGYIEIKGLGNNYKTKTTTKSKNNKTTVNKTIVSPVSVNNTSKSITEDHFDLAVKNLIAEFIINGNAFTREEITEYVNAIMNITDKLKKKLF